MQIVCSHRISTQYYEMSPSNHGASKGQSCAIKNNVSPKIEFNKKEAQGIFNQWYSNFNVTKAFNAADGVC